MADTTRPHTEPPAIHAEVLPLSEVAPDAANARQHGRQNKAAIRNSLKRFGPGRSIVLDRDNTVRAGNGTVAEAAAAGITEVLVVEPQPHQIVAVRRPDWSHTEATAYGIADNRAGDLSKFDDLALAQTLEAVRNDGIDLADVGYTEKRAEAVYERVAAKLAGRLDAGGDAPPDGVVLVDGGGLPVPKGKLPLLRFGRIKVAMTHDEAAGLRDAFDRYLALKGGSGGFVHALLAGALAPGPEPEANEGRGA